MNLLKNKYFVFIFTILLFFFGSLFQLIPISIFNLNIDALTNSQTILLTLFSNFIILLILIYIYFKDIKEDLKTFKNNFIKIIDKAFGIWVIGLTFMALSNIIINYFSPNEIANNEESIRTLISARPYLMLINTALLAPIIEELTFRKAFKNIFKNKYAFILISGLVFGGLHVITSIENVYDYLYLIPYCSLGIAFSYMYYETDNIIAPIFMHITHNTIITILNIFTLGMII